VFMLPSFAMRDWKVSTANGSVSKQAGVTKKATSG
jgi:hypothetical protein